MAKSIKLDSPYYWDSSSVVYNRATLDTVLTKLNTKINNTKDYLKIYKANSLEPLDWPGAVGQWTIFGNMTTGESYGSLLTRNGNYIQVGKNVEKIRIKAKVICQIDSWSANDWLFLGIGKNGGSTNIGTEISKSLISELHWITLQCETIVDVVEGDKFAMYVRNEENKSFKFYNYTGFGNSPECFLEAEVIKYSDNFY